MRIIGWDSASQERNNGLVLGELSSSGGVALLEKYEPGEDLEGLLQSWIGEGGPVLLAVDSPLGWPAPFGSALEKHRAGDGLLPEAEDFFRRRTDRYIRRTFGKLPLEISADRIARSAFATLNRLARLRSASSRELPLLWEPSAKEGVVEVYPAATLLAGNRLVRGYKKAAARELREGLLRDLAEDYGLTPPEGADFADFSRRDHDCDAVICCLAGADFLKGRAAPPPPDLPREELRREGWCWVRLPEDEL